MSATEVLSPDLLSRMLDTVLVSRVAGLALVAVAVGLMSFMILRVTGRRRLSARRLKMAEIAGPDVHAGAPDVAHWLSPAQRYLLPSDEKERVSVSRRLIQAGFRHEHALLFFYSCKATTALLLGLLLLLVHPWLPGALAEYTGLSVMLGAVLGLLIPSWVLNSQLRHRHQQLIEGLPQALDMLLICLTAGLGLPMAISRVEKELRLAYPVLADELAQVRAELNAGMAMDAALHHFSERTGLREVRGLVGTLVEAHRYGSNLADTLSDYTRDFRAMRLHRADMQAAKMSTRLVFPMVCCIWPGFFVVVVGPALLRLLEAFGG